MAANGYEQAARDLKVDRILAKVPKPLSMSEVGIIAQWLTEFSVDDRARFAAEAGCKPPSQTTWNAVIAGAAARRPEQGRRSA